MLCCVFFFFKIGWITLVLLSMWVYDSKKYNIQSASSFVDLDLNNDKVT